MTEANLLSHFVAIGWRLARFSQSTQALGQSYCFMDVTLTSKVIVNHCVRMFIFGRSSFCTSFDRCGRLPRRMFRHPFVCCIGILSVCWLCFWRDVQHTDNFCSLFPIREQTSLPGAPASLRDDYFCDQKRHPHRMFLSAPMFQCWWCCQHPPRMFFLLLRIGTSPPRCKIQDVPYPQRTKNILTILSWMFFFSSDGLETSFHFPRWADTVTDGLAGL